MLGFIILYFLIFTSERSERVPGNVVILHDSRVIVTTSDISSRSSLLLRTALLSRALLESSKSRSSE